MIDLLKAPHKRRERERERERKRERGEVFVCLGFE